MTTWPRTSVGTLKRQLAAGGVLWAVTSRRIEDAERKLAKARLDAALSREREAA